MQKSLVKRKVLYQFQDELLLVKIYFLNSSFKCLVTTNTMLRQRLVIPCHTELLLWMYDHGVKPLVP